MQNSFAADGAIRDLSGVIADLGPAEISPAGLAKLAAIDPASLPKVEGNPRYGACVTGTRQFVAIGLNYADHAAESNLPIPEEPVVFQKWVSCIQGPNDPVTIPKDSKKTDWEVELGVIIGKRARRGHRRRHQVGRQPVGLGVGLRVFPEPRPRLVRQPGERRRVDRGSGGIGRVDATFFELVVIQSAAVPPVELAGQLVEHVGAELRLERGEIDSAAIVGGQSRGGYVQLGRIARAADAVERLLGNHLFENVAALAIVGNCFDGPSARQWLHVGRTLLERELQEQILPDGGHFERSPMYQSRVVYVLTQLQNVADPSLVDGSREMRLAAYRAVRDDLLKKLKERFPSGG